MAAISSRRTSHSVDAPSKRSEDHGDAPTFFDLDPNTLHNREEAPSSSRAASIVRAAVPTLLPIADRSTFAEQTGSSKAPHGDSSVLFNFVKISSNSADNTTGQTANFVSRNLLVHKSLAARRRRSRLFLRNVLPPPLSLTATSVAYIGPRLVNKWDHYAREYGISRDLICEVYGDPDADAYLYTFWREAERSSPWWHSALVMRDPSHLSAAGCAAMWFPLIASSCASSSLAQITNYANAFSHIVDPPRSEAGRRLRRSMADGDLISGFSQEFFDLVQMDIAPEYRTDMAIALMFLVIEAFVGELIPPKYIVRMAAESIAKSLDLTGYEQLSLDHIIPASFFRRALFSYLDRWVETALFAEWREMLSSLLHAVTPALPVALRMTALEFHKSNRSKNVGLLPPLQRALASNPRSDQPSYIWQWAAPFCRDGGYYWIPFTEETNEKLEDYWQSDVPQTTQTSVIDADHFQELVCWRSLTVHRHDRVPLKIRRNSQMNVFVKSVAPDFTPKEEVRVDWTSSYSKLPQIPDRASCIPTDHWASTLYPFPNEVDKQLSQFSLLVQHESSPLPLPDQISCQDVFPTWESHFHMRRNLEPESSQTPAATDPELLIRIGQPSIPLHVVSGIVCADDLGADDVITNLVSTNSSEALPPLSKASRKALQNLRHGGSWVGSSDRAEVDSESSTSSFDVIVHYLDDHCTARAGISFPTLLRLLQKSSGTGETDALLVCGSLFRAEASHPTPLTALDIQLLKPEPRPTRCDPAEVSSFTFDVFLACDKAIDAVLRPLLITTGGLGILRPLIAALKETASWMTDSHTLSMSFSNVNNSDGESNGNVHNLLSVGRIASKTHVKVVIECCPPPSDWGKAVASDAGRATNAIILPTVDLSLGAALMMELRRLNPKNRVQMPLGGPRPRSLWPPERAGRRQRAAEIECTDASLPLAGSRVAFQQKLSRNPQYLFNAISPNHRAPRSGSAGFIIGDATPSSASDSLTKMLGRSSSVPLQQYDPECIFGSRKSPTPMGLGTLIRGIARSQSQTKGTRASKVQSSPNQRKVILPPMQPQ